MKITGRNMVNKALTDKRRFREKSSDVRNKSMTKINKGGMIMSLKKCIMTSSSLVMTHSRAKINQLTRKLSKCPLLTQDLRHIW